MINACPICGEKSYEICYHGLFASKALLVKCVHCNHFYTRLADDIDEGKLYSEEAYLMVDTRQSVFDRILDWDYKKIIRRINHIKSEKSSLLDFGAGKGKFASLAKQNGWVVKCVETAELRADFAERIYALEVNRNYYSSGRIFQNDFDVLVMLHVLEHLKQPKNLLRELIRSNLKKDGLLIIEVPNFNSLQSKLAGKNWIHLDIPRHLNHFTKEQLETMAKELVLESRRTDHFSFHLGVLGMVDSFLKLFGYRGNLIYDLKNRKTIALLSAIVVLLPVSILLEIFAAMLGQGGILRKYYIVK